MEVSWPSHGLVHWTQVLVLSECGFESRLGRSRRLCPWARHNCFVLRMGRKAIGPVCCVMHVKEPRTLIVKEKGLAPSVSGFAPWAPSRVGMCALQIFFIIIISVPLVFYPIPWHSTPRKMDLGHSWHVVPQTDVHVLRKQQWSLGDLPGVWENRISRAHLRVQHILPTADGSPASSLRLRLVLQELASCGND